jgi:hypothetical protein
LGQGGGQEGGASRQANAAASSRTRGAGLLPATVLFLLLAGVAWPLARGSETLFLRDVFNAHLPMKQAQAEALRAGRMPLIDPYRAGGQPLAGNPNAVPFYPDNLLYLKAPVVWALNAHFWIHLLLAPLAFVWLARAWGLGKEASWVAAALWTTGGFFLSHLAFYNLIAGVTLAPAFVAAALDLACWERRLPAGYKPKSNKSAGRMPALPAPSLPGRRRWSAPLLAVLWGLLLVSGDPLMAGLALLMALGAVVCALAGRRRCGEGADPLIARRGTDSGNSSGLGRFLVWVGRKRESDGGRLSPVGGVRRFLPLTLGLIGALAAGTLLAAPQLVEFVRILSLSFRGHWGFNPEAATIASWDPRQAVEQLIPFAFGRPDLLERGSFWGSRFYTGFPPYYFSLYPGLLAFALAAAAGLRGGGHRRAAVWAWGSIGLGLFFALGRFNPVAAWLLSLVGGGALRYPVKLWLPVAAGLALLGGLGFEALRGEPRVRRRFGFALALLAGLFALAWTLLALRADLSGPWLRGLVPASFSDGFVASERLRLAALCLVSLVLIGALAVAARLGRRWPVVGAALLVGLHAGSQLWLMRPLRPTDAVVPYGVPPPALDFVPADAEVVHGSYLRLFGSSDLSSGRFPAPHSRWLERRAFFELYPMTGAQWRRRFELNVSPEGLDSFLTRVSQGAVKGAPDSARIRLLAAWGVDRLLLDRPLDGMAVVGAPLLARIPSSGGLLHVYGVEPSAPDVYLARRIWRAPHLQAAVGQMLDPRFDSARDAVLPGEGPVVSTGGGRVRLVRRADPEAVEVEVSASGPSYLIFQRAHLPIYRASVDGAGVEVEVANLHRIGVAVPAGRHRVRLWVERGSLSWSFGASGVGLLGVGLLAFRRRGR